MQVFSHSRVVAALLRVLCGILRALCGQKSSQRPRLGRREAPTRNLTENPYQSQAIIGWL
jgi:hypothetical protein